VIVDDNNKPVYLQTTGPTALASRDKELIGHGTDYHLEGFGSPLGKLKGINLAIEDMFPKDLEVYGIYEGKKTTLLFEGNVKVEGEVITGKRDLKGKILLISFKNCTVMHNDKVLFQPAWGVYDMAVGKDIISAHAGPASVNSFKNLGEVSKTKTHKISYSEEEIKLHKMYQEIAEMRKSGEVDFKKLIAVFGKLKANFPTDWLLPLEMYELVYQSNKTLETEILTYLTLLQKNKKHKQLIANGIRLISK